MITSVYDILAIIWTVIGILITIYVAIGIIRYLNRKNALNEYEINLAYDTSNIENELDTIIQNAITVYVALNLSYQDNVYINDKMEEEIRNSVVGDVNDKLTLTMLNKLALVYKSERLEDIIAVKIYLAVMLYRVQHNSGKTATPNETKPEE